MDQIISIDASLVPTIWEIIKNIPNQGGKWLTEELANNQFLVATVIPAVLLGAWYGVRGAFYVFMKYFKMLMTSEVTFNSDNEYYHEITKYLYDASLSKMFQRFFTISYNWQTEGLILTIGYGTSLGFIGWWPVIISRTVEESQSAKFKEKVAITIIGGRRSAINDLMSNLDKVVNQYQTTDMVSIYMAGKDGGIDRVAQKPYRELDTILIPQTDKDYITDKLDKFMKSEAYYINKGLPYHIGVILSGPAGTGKTSLIHALASRYKRDVCFCPGGQIKLNGMDLKKTFLVIEDIDANGMMVGRRNTDDGASPDEQEIVKALAGESMSGILNVLDGLVSPHGLITFATTNHYDRLDPAIVRPGRFDIHLEFKNMAWSEWLGLCKLLDRASAVDQDAYVEISPAQARYMLLYYSDDDIREFFKNPIDTVGDTPSVAESAAIMGAVDDDRHTPSRGRRYRG